MTRQQFGQWALAAGMIGFGILTVSTGDFVAPWEAVPAWVPARTLLAYACGYQGMTAVIAPAAGSGIRRFKRNR